jgi:hypothetical protein
MDAAPGAGGGAVPADSASAATAGLHCICSWCGLNRLSFFHRTGQGRA